MNAHRWNLARMFVQRVPSWVTTGLWRFLGLYKQRRFSWLELNETSVKMGPSTRPIRVRHNSRGNNKSVCPTVATCFSALLVTFLTLRRELDILASRGCGTTTKLLFPIVQFQFGWQVAKLHQLCINILQVCSCFWCWKVRHWIQQAPSTKQAIRHMFCSTPSYGDGNRTQIQLFHSNPSVWVAFISISITYPLSWLMANIKTGPDYMTPYQVLQNMCLLILLNGSRGYRIWVFMEAFSSKECHWGLHLVTETRPWRSYHLHLK